MIKPDSKYWYVEKDGTAVARFIGGVASDAIVNSESLTIKTADTRNDLLNIQIDESVLSESERKILPVM